VRTALPDVCGPLHSGFPRVLEIVNGTAAALRASMVTWGPARGMGTGSVAEAWKKAASAAMESYACGDDGAFSELYDLLAPRIATFLQRRMRDDALAWDLVQQTFLRMHCARRHFARGADVVPWCFAIARRLFIDWLRKNSRERESVTMGIGLEERESVAPDAGPDEELGRRRLAGRIEEELAQLPEIHRVAFDLVKRDGLSLAEAAEVLGTTVTAVKLRLHRAYEALRAALGDEVREQLEIHV
jgi:RNA polymerase sigma-70 factor, ECF subfamily